MTPPCSWLSWNTKGTPTASLATQANAALEGLPFRTLDGAPVSPAGLKGKVVVLNYWATWCVPCRSEIPGSSIASIVTRR